MTGQGHIKVYTSHDHRTKNLRGVDRNSMLVLRARHISYTSPCVIPATVDLKASMVGSDASHSIAGAKDGSRGYARGRIGCVPFGHVPVGVLRPGMASSIWLGAAIGVRVSAPGFSPVVRARAGGPSRPERAIDCGRFVPSFDDNQVEARRSDVAVGLTETINACGGLVRPGFGLAEANEAGTHPGAVRSARGAEGISVIHSGEDVKLSLGRRLPNPP